MRKYMSPIVALKAKNNPAYMRAVEKAYAYFNRPTERADIISRQTQDFGWIHTDWTVRIDGYNFIPHYNSLTGIIEVWFT